MIEYAARNCCCATRAWLFAKNLYGFFCEGHRANILTESYTAMAVAVCEHSNGWYYTSNFFVGDWQY